MAFFIFGISSAGIEHPDALAFLESMRVGRVNGSNLLDAEASAKASVILHKPISANYQRILLGPFLFSDWSPSLLEWTGWK